MSLLQFLERREIMGHTIRMKGVKGSCEGKAIRIDVGMLRGCGNGLPEILEITKNSEVRILTAKPAYWDSYGARKMRSGRSDGLGVLLDDRPKQIQFRACIFLDDFEELHVIAPGG